MITKINEYYYTINLRAIQFTNDFLVRYVEDYDGSMIIFDPPTSPKEGEPSLIVEDISKGH